MNIFIREKKDEKTLINLARMVFTSLIVFELLNVLKILKLNTQFTWLGLLISACFAFALLEAVAYRFKLTKGHLLHWSIWLIVALALSLDAFGDFFHLYARVAWWDQVAHYSTSAIICFILFTVISAFWIDQFKFSLLFKTGRLKLATFLAATSTLSLGALYEIEEYVEDLLFQTHRLGPGSDTANDLTFNLLGILTAVTFIIVYYLITHKREVIE